MNFIEPGGRISVMKSSPLPAPLHTAPSFLRFSFLSAADKFAITRALVPLTLTVQRDTGKSFSNGSMQHGQTKQRRRSLLAPDTDQRPQRGTRPHLRFRRCPGGARIDEDSAARHMGVPTCPSPTSTTQPVTTSAPAAASCISACPVEGFSADAFCAVRSSRLEQGCHREAISEADFDYLVARASVRCAGSRASRKPRERRRFARRSRTSKTRPSPASISGSTARSPISTTPFSSTAPFSGCSTSRACNRCARKANNGSRGGSYIELVVSSSKTLIDKSRAEIVDLALREVREFFPAAREAKL